MSSYALERRQSQTSERLRAMPDKVDWVNEAFRYDEEKGLQASVTSTVGQNTTTVKSLTQYTREALPRADHYRNALTLHDHFERPTLEELHGTFSPDRKKSISLIQNSLLEEVFVSNKFGWIQGVFIRCILNIWGVMLFLRLSWVVGQAGLGLSLLVILLATTVTTLTTLSMSAICTNGEVKAGGSYYMISRSLGPEFGGSIGLVFSLANAVSVSMYVVGFAETLVDMLKGYQIIDGGINDVRILSCATVVVLLGIALIGTEWESKAQMVLLVILLTALMDFFVGSFMKPTAGQLSQGFKGWDAALALENFKPSFREKETFFSVFAVFFPAATGITAGANISGDLKDPQRSIPKGTLLAILVTTLSYVCIAVIVACSVFRDANGVLPNATFLNDNVTLLLNDNTTLLLNDNFIKYCPANGCKYGSINNFQILEMVSAFGPIIYAGVFAATLSSALASLVSAPKIFQALCKDRLFPYIHVFAKGYGKSGEPRRCYILAFVIALACCAIGDLNAIAPIISNFFLAAYCLMNFSCFHASFARSPGFRPGFKYYSMWTSLLGANLCLAVMFVIKWWTALLTFALVLALHTYVHYRKPDVNWGSSTQAQLYMDALTSVLKLNQAKEHVKNYRPQILVLSGSPSCRPPLIDFVAQITRKQSALICGHVITEHNVFRYREKIENQGYNWLQKKKIKAFYNLVEEESFSRGVRSLIQSSGLGKLRPNVLVIGYKSEWWFSTVEDLNEYFAVIHDAFDLNMSLAIFRLPNGLDYSAYGDFEELKLEEERMTSDGDLPRKDTDGDESPNIVPSSGKLWTSIKVNIPHARVMRGLSKDVSKDILSSVNQFQTKQVGSIDVWWLYDDGGLTMLVPHILKTHSQWSDCKLRVFSLANKKEELDRDLRNMASLLSKFRIEYSDVKVIPDVSKKPKDKSTTEFDELLSRWQSRDSTTGSLPVEESEIATLADKTKRHIRLRELLDENSQDASLIVMTLPMPRKGICSAPMYMAWLETLTKGLPPFLLIRGNQTSVLTFYS